MKFEKAFELAFNRLDAVEREKGMALAVSPKTAKTLVLFWNMMKEAKGKLDDFVMIDTGNNIISIDHIDPVRQVSTEVSVFDLLDTWAKDREIKEQISPSTVSELLSSANEKISRGVYFHEFSEWLSLKKIEVTEELEGEVVADNKKEEVKVDSLTGNDLLDSLEIELPDIEISFEDVEKLFLKTEEQAGGIENKGVSFELFITWVQSKNVEVLVEDK